MLSGHLPTRSPVRLTTALVGLSIALALVAGCNENSYDPKLSYPVRTDWLVAGGTWEVNPVKFNLPGRLPLDQLRETINLPEKDVSADQLTLRAWVNKKIFDPTKLAAETRADYGKQMEAMFGTPAAPKAGSFNADALKAAEDGLTGDTIVTALGLSDDVLAKGSRLYRVQCLHCHGLDGNGRGPTGPWVNPPPRDYRQGVFKFTSSNQEQGVRKPRREDLLHIVTTGIEGSSMPSFGTLSLDDRQAVVSYVIHLSLRGETEYLTMLDQVKDEKQKLTMTLREDAVKNPTLKDALEDNLALAASRWVAAQKPDIAIAPAPYPYANDDKAFLDSAARGAKVFAGAGGCIQCHQNYGREANLVYDAWGSIVRGRNLYEGVYRGGRRPLDLFYRIHSGINGAGMTAYKDIKNQLKPEDVGLTAEQFEKADPLWDMVNYLRALGYVEMRSKLRAEPYKLNLPE